MANTAAQTGNAAELIYQDSLAQARIGQWPQALLLAKQAISLQPYNADYHAQEGAALFMLNEYAQATDSFIRAIGLNNKHLGALNNLAYIYNQAACYAMAENLLQQSLAIDPGQLDPWLSLCYAAQNLDHREDDAVEYALRAAALAPNNPLPYNYLSRARLAQGDLPGALEAIQIAAHLDPGNTHYQYRAGICLLQMEKVPEAMQAFQAVLEMDPEHCDTLMALAQYFFDTENFAAAEEACLMAERKAANQYPVHELLAKILFITGRYDEAKRYFDHNMRQLFALSKQEMPDSRTGWAPVQSICSWSASQSLPLIPKLPAATFQTDDVLCFGADPEGAKAELVTLPATYVAEVENALIMPGHEVILVDNEQHALYERLTVFQDYYALRPDEYIPLVSSSHIMFHAREKEPEHIPVGIFLLTEAMNNYAHWISEQLPRFLLLQDHPEYDGLPVLISDGLYPQQIEALNCLIGDRYPVRKLDLKHSFTVDRLIYPSILTAYYKRRFREHERASATDGAMHPEAIHYLRDRILPLVATGTAPTRRIWISRRKQLRRGQRRLINETELEALFVSHGFESIKPEDMSFLEQVKVFSEAAMIAGPGGAAFMNVIFAPPGCRSLLVTKNHPQVNFHYFTSIAKVIGQSMAYVCGETVKNHGVLGFETDFTVDLRLVREAMEKFLRI